jgi:hypothetical protein
MLFDGFQEIIRARSGSALIGLGLFETVRNALSKSLTRWRIYFAALFR